MKAQTTNSWPSTHSATLLPAMDYMLKRGDRAAMMYFLIVTAKIKDADPQSGLADVLARIAANHVQRLEELPTWTWRERNEQVVQAA